MTPSFHKHKDDTTPSATPTASGIPKMIKATRLALAGLFCLSLAACATQAVDTTPPPAKRLDAKTTLEGRR